MTESLTIGRSRTADLRIPDETASAEHARVFSANDAIWIEDLRSKNGTFVNSERVSGPVRLSLGDSVRIGETEIGVVEARPAR